MKLSIVISTQPTQFNALAYQGKLKENINNIRSMGYDGVELAVRDPKLLDLDLIKKLTIEKDFPVSALGTGQAYGEEGLSFSDPKRSVRRKAIQRIKEQIELATELDAIVIIGLVRGKVQPDIDYDQAEEWLLEALEECAKVNPDVELVLEPCNRYEANMINTAEEGIQLLDKLGLDNVGLLLDTFHMNIEEPDILKSFQKAGSRVFHVHIADSNRWYPGAGHIDFNSIVLELEKLNYEGFLSAEIMPKPDVAKAAEETIRYMRSMIRK